MVSPAVLELVTGKMAVPVIRCTRDLRYAWANERYAEWIRRPVNDIIGAKIQDVLGTEAFLRLLPYFERVLSGQTSGYEEKIAFAGIGERWVSAVYTPTLDAQGKPDGWVAVVRDITDQKLMEATLREQQKQLAEEAMALANLNDCSLRLWQTDNLMEGLRQMLVSVIGLLRADKGTVQIFDPEKEVLKIATHIGFGPEFLDHFCEVSVKDDSACSRALRTCQTVIIADTENDAAYAPYREVARAAGYKAVTSMPMLTRDGKVLGLLSTHFCSVYRPSDQELRRLELYARQAADFIERCKWEEALRSSEERERRARQLFESFVEHSPATVFLKDEDGRYVYTNAIIRRRFSPALVGKTDFESFPPAFAAQYRENDLLVLNENKALEFIETTCEADGEHALISVKFPVIDADGRRLLAGQSIDITERKKVEDALAKARDELELRVEERTREARELSRRLLETQNQERRNAARELHDSAGQTLALLHMTLHQLIDACKDSSEATTLATKTEEFVRQLDREIRTATYLLHPPLLDESGFASALGIYLEGLRTRSGLQIEFTLSDHFPRLPAELELVLFRVVQECLTNTHKHSGSKRASIRLTNEQQNVVVEIRDEGKGISAERLAAIQSAGLGLGIRGMRERVQQFNGTLVFDPSASGTRVLVSVPIPKPAMSEGSQPLEAAV